MAEVVLLMRSKADNSPIVSTLNKAQDEIYSFMENISEHIRAKPYEEYFVVDKNSFDIRAKEIVCAILNSDKERYSKLNIIQLKDEQM